MKKRISIHDIAKHLNVSATTVSFVLNGRANEMRISDEVKTRVSKYVAEIGYQPNLVAKSLRTGKSKIIGMMVEDISDVFFSGIARGIERRAYKLGYKIFFASTENETEKAKALIRVFRERQVDGYIIAPPPGLESEIILLTEDEKPVILFDRYFPGTKTNNVTVNNQEGAHIAVTHLQQNGYENIGFVTLESEQSQMHDRMQGYLEAIRGRKQKQYVLKVLYSLFDASVLKKIRDFINNYPQMDAVFFATNYLAKSGIEAIKSLKLSIPEDLAVISFDDNDVFRLISPSITAIAQPMEEIAEAVVNKIMECLQATEVPAPETIVLPTCLRVRNSTSKKTKPMILNDT